VAELSAILFVVTALGGAGMAAQRLRGADLPPKAFAFGHGALAALALVLYVIVLVGADDPPAAGVWGVIVLVAAALGGTTMALGFHRRGRPLPVPLMLGHGALAPIGVVLVLVAVFSGAGGTDTAPVY
jgi:hypothetical protein